MTDAIVHRGPDDFGYLLLDSHNGKFQTGQTGFQWQPCDVFLGNRRLSIIDLSPNGRQPIRNEASDTFAIFNGEIFNYLELRNLLRLKDISSVHKPTPKSLSMLMSSGEPTA